MRVRFLLGPAGSGKTFRCLTEIRQALAASQDGPALLFVTPRQSTYQIERQLLADSSTPGFARLHILSFERLAHFLFQRLGQTPPNLIDDEGRVMVLRGLLAKRRNDLKLFRASARLTGFAQQLNLALRELQRHQQTPESLAALAAQFPHQPGLAGKLHDLATLLALYLEWLKEHQLQDVDCLLAAASEALTEQTTAWNSTQPAEASPSPFGRGLGEGDLRFPPCPPVHGQGWGREAAFPQTTSQPPRAFTFAGLWIDGFAEFSPQELELLAALLPLGEHATLAFCLDHAPAKKLSWLSPWSFIGRSFEDCRKRLGNLPGIETFVEVLPRHSTQNRFGGNPVLAHLEKYWSDPQPYNPEGANGTYLSAGLINTPIHGGVRTSRMDGTVSTVSIRTGVNVLRKTVETVLQHPATSNQHPDPRIQHLASSIQPPASSLQQPASRDTPSTSPALSLFTCHDPEAEVTLAAREIARHIRAGGRFREISVVVRKLEGYYESVQRVFSRYEIPFFLDRRESVSHHPLAELTRSALRTIASQWMRDDWFAALKTGLVPVEENDIDRLENEALARGWKGAIWQKPIVVADDPDLTAWLADVQHRLLPPFQRLALVLATQQNRPTGPQLAAALREFWETLKVEERLQQWAEAEIPGSEDRFPNSVHATVWDQMNALLDNIELAFSTEALPLREWLPILDAGLAGLTVGVIPPALDQVLVGAIDRSRNPDLKLVLILGLNETVFPAPPESASILSENDRLELEKQNVILGASARQQLGRERFYAYIACTRARERVVLTSALHDASGSPLNPSPFLSHLKLLFPSLEPELFPRTIDWRESEHASELIGPMLKVLSAKSAPKGLAGQTTNSSPELSTSNFQPATLPLLRIPALANLAEQLRHIRPPASNESLSPELASRLYGSVLHTSVSRIEQFAACPFKFFIHSGMRAKERLLYELDSREQGSFQHDVLALFHQQLEAEHKRWCDLAPSEARARIAAAASGLMASYRDGLLQASEQSRFLARTMIASLQDFVEILVGWMRDQYRFEPVDVELPFGEDGIAAWTVALEPEGKDAASTSGTASARLPRLEFVGRIDRVDLFRDPASDEAYCIVVDYKSSHKHLDPILLANGLQLQLLTYLNVMRDWPNPRERFGVAQLVPAGVFYVNLRGKYDREQNRLDALANPEQARKRAYRHAGRFDARTLRLLDARTDARQGDQFSYRLNNDGQLHKSSREALTTADFESLLDSAKMNLRRMGREIFAGVARVAPYRKGTATACDQCDYRAICRIDPWTHNFRMLRADPVEDDVRSP